jgi:hypothetical protein
LEWQPHPDAAWLCFPVEFPWIAGVAASMIIKRAIIKAFGRNFMLLY